MGSYRTGSADSRMTNRFLLEPVFARAGGCAMESLWSFSDWIDAAPTHAKKVGLGDLPRPTEDPSFELSKEDLALRSYPQLVRVEQIPRPKKGPQPKGQTKSSGSLFRNGTCASRAFEPK